MDLRGVQDLEVPTESLVQTERKDESEIQGTPASQVRRENLGPRVTWAQWA